MRSTDVRRPSEAAHTARGARLRAAAEQLFGDRSAPDGSLVADNFVRWFGDSRARNADGTPFELYHGTNKAFDVFAMQAGPRSRLVGDWDGAHFTNDIEQARSIAEGLARREGGSARVVRVYLRACNPAPLGRFRTQAEAMAAGHDSRLTENNVGLQEWTVFRPEQVKAVEGSGLFDLHSDDMTDAHGWSMADIDSTEDELRGTARMSA